MSPLPDKSSLLDQLRQQSAALQAQEGAKRRPLEEAQQDLDRRLWQAFRWLDEALRHLEVIKPDVAHTFRLDPIVAIASPRYDCGFVSYRRRAFGRLELLEHVEVFYRLVKDGEIVLSVRPGAVRGIEERLRLAHLPYHYQTEMDQNRVVRHGVFRVTPEISCSIRFAPDYRRQVVEVALHNVDRFEGVVLEFGGLAIDETVLEELLHFIMGESNTFLHRAPLVGVGARPSTAPQASAATPPPVIARAGAP